MQYVLEHAKEQRNQFLRTLSNYHNFLPHIICEYARIGVVNAINCVVLVCLLSSRMEETASRCEGNCGPPKKGGPIA